MRHVTVVGLRVMRVVSLGKRLLPTIVGHTVRVVLIAALGSLGEGRKLCRELIDGHHRWRGPLGLQRFGRRMVMSGLKSEVSSGSWLPFSVAHALGDSHICQ